tara:strand:- start:93457 stop:93930 length:474 start_codon:yes stop_codon:yes gene_type:complete
MPFSKFKSMPGIFDAIIIEDVPKEKRPTRPKKYASKTGASAPKRVGKLLQAQQRVEFLIDSLGSQRELAELLNVSRGQPSKWLKGAESPSADTGAFLVDLDHVIARASLVWGGEVSKRWLVGSEPFLGGARPIDVLRQYGSRDVIDALDAVTAGSYS